MPEVVVCDNLPQYNDGVFDDVAEGVYSNGKKRRSYGYLNNPI